MPVHRVWKGAPGPLGGLKGEAGHVHAVLLHLGRHAGPQGLEGLDHVEVEDPDAALPQHAEDVAKTVLQLARLQDVVEAVEGAQSAVKDGPEPELAGVGEHEASRRGVLAGVGKHGGGAVQAGDAVAPLAEGAGQVAGAATDIQEARPGRDARQQQLLDGAKRLAVILRPPTPTVHPGEGVIGGVAESAVHSVGRRA